MNNRYGSTLPAAVLACLMAVAATMAAQAALADASAAGDQAARQAEYQAMLEDAARVRADAEAARREAMRTAERARETARLQAEQARAESRQAGERTEEAERQRAVRREEMERVQEELSRAHRELREATREIARAHRELMRSTGTYAAVREINLGERAVIGVVLGRETHAGVPVIGVSPDGPAERAGLQSGDVMVSVRGEDLGGAAGKDGREILARVIGEAAPGEALAVVVDRGGETWKFEVTPEQREPASWQSLLRLPDPPAPPAAPASAGEPGAPPAPQIIVKHIEHMEIPDIDEEALNQHVRQLTEELKTRKFRFLARDGETLEIDGELELPESLDGGPLVFSNLAEQALREANVWFGLPHLQGLELAPINEGLGAYFKTARGVLVVNARAGNAYGLEPGDVLLNINARPVDSPADVMRALREIDPGSEVALAIKRERKNKTLTVTMPENRLGYAWFPHTDRG